MPPLKPAASTTVAVTGATGFIGSHCVKALLESGYSVRCVVRDPSDASKIAHLEKMRPDGAEPGRLTFHSGDLLKEGSYNAAFKGCQGVIHTAAVVQMQAKDPQREIVDPSIEGTKNILSAVDAAGTVQRIVHTSSIAAVYNMAAENGTVFTEADFNTWGNLGNGDAYGYAKLSAERLATSHADGKGYDVVAINPALVLGECLTKAHTKASPVFVRQLLFGNEVHDVFTAVVDVRDVARAHVAALSSGAAANGARFILAADGPGMRLSAVARRCGELRPDLLFTAVTPHYLKAFVQSFFMTEFQRLITTKEFGYSNARAKAGLGLAFTPVDDCLRATVASMVETGWVQPRRK